jgi:hypothetical protein
MDIRIQHMSSLFTDDDTGIEYLPEGLKERGPMPHNSS